ncbi:hypothetical protein RYX36_022297 [Vicia faba]
MRNVVRKWKLKLTDQSSSDASSMTVIRSRKPDMFASRFSDDVIKVSVMKIIVVTLFELNKVKMMMPRSVVDLVRLMKIIVMPRLNQRVEIMKIMQRICVLNQRAR